jgi:hypothetical protein
VHYGQTDAIHAARQNTLDGAFNRNPERFVRKRWAYRLMATTCTD